MNKIIITLSMILLSQVASAHPFFAQSKHPANQKRFNHHLMNQSNVDTGKFGVANRTSAPSVEIAEAAEKGHTSGSTDPYLLGTFLAPGQQTLFTLLPAGDDTPVMQRGEIRVHDATGNVIPVCFFKFQSFPGGITNGAYPWTSITNTSNQYHCAFDKAALKPDELGNSIITVLNGPEPTSSKQYHVVIQNELANEKIRLIQTTDDNVIVKPTFNSAVINPKKSSTFTVSSNNNYHDSLGYLDVEDFENTSFLVSVESRNGDKQILCSMYMDEGYSFTTNQHTELYTDVFKLTSSDHQCVISSNESSINLTIK